MFKPRLKPFSGRVAGAVAKGVLDGSIDAQIELRRVEEVIAAITAILEEPFPCQLDETGSKLSAQKTEGERPGREPRAGRA